MNKKLLIIPAIILLTIGIVFLFNIEDRDLEAAPINVSVDGTITDDEAIIMMQEDDSIILIDVRNRDEHIKQRIPGSVLIPLDELETEIMHRIPDKETIIIVHCQKGIRSKEAAELLTILGYLNVYDLGGIEDWKYNVIEGF